MSHRGLPYTLTPVGYLIVRDPDEALEHDEYFRKFGRYCGVDRLPLFIAPDPEVRKLLGEPLVEDDVLYAALEEWFDSCFRNTAFIPNRYQALRLLKAFRAFGFKLELVYCQLAWKEGEEERLKAYAKADEESPVVSLTYGFDVSWPSCNHSAIFQPGVVPANPLWRNKLNEDGLLNDHEDAARLRNEYLAIYPYPPFDIYLIHKVVTSE